MDKTTALALPGEEQFRHDIEAINRFQDIVHANLKEGQDFGIIPGTQKPTLLKPGAEKIAKLLGLCDHYEEMTSIEDWDKPFFYYKYKCRLVTLQDDVLSEGVGSCNSKEDKYRWRDSKRVCPNCGKSTIIKGKEEYGGGWLCFKKQGGCGAKYEYSDPLIMQQPSGKVENDDIYSIVNTILKMAKKRALVDAALSVGRLSGVFTQDMEDLGPVPPADEEPKATMRVAGEVTPSNPPERTKSPKKQGAKPKDNVTITQKEIDRLCELLNCDALDLTARAMERFDPNASFGLTDISQVRSVKAQEWIKEEEAKGAE